MSDEERYQEILRRIEAQKQKAQTQQVVQSLQEILDNLNVMDMMQEIRRDALAKHGVYGPKVFEGADWLGVLIWYKNRGYYGYRVLRVGGIWAIQEGETIKICFGTKTLEYQASVYNAESYHKLIRDKFDLYYNDKGNPPTDALYQTVYNSTERLAIRQNLQKHLLKWVTSQG